jgi:RNA polymerase sigma-70 factor (ECF subfamily)
MAERMDVRAMTLGIREGREAAFDSFYSGYADRMYRYLLVSVKGDEERARDVLQDALLRVVRHLPPLDTAEDLWRYLTRVMRSALVDHLRRASRSSGGRAPSPGPRRETAEDSEEKAGGRLFQLLERALAALSANDRRILEEHYFAGASQAEIAERIEASHKGLAMRLSRLRRRLREFILEGLKRE